MDDRPGYDHYDYRRSAGNTNDLRGKILRIKINEDGSYSIPDGNLFPKGEDSTRPEIYVMGDRNPYRIEVDQKTTFYIGEKWDLMPIMIVWLPVALVVMMNLTRQERPVFLDGRLFIANNIPYRHYDYATGKSGELFDPQHPVNDSRNNTGKRILPPANRHISGIRTRI